ncbi:ABC transporter substrate-binding protein [Ruoffia tabacinasalis]|uniref:ABC transporter substrate-binding protein n=1 Tax=Ruoffia tabacinasalis TaxID=87458 RepID=A0ABS0LKJ4_9LACT|nr:ABC transporter substrate-binding protein [Ruoffia tabacinasalis]MBG9978744.1 ABC transporter substrate-binding protein [Ruoffia tabacinasalis]
MKKKGSLLKRVSILFSVMGVLGMGSPLASRAQESQGVNSNETLNIAFSSNLTTLDPHLTTNQATRDVGRQIFETLLTLNENYEVIPQLAKSYEVSEDGLVYTFYLRDDVQFHNGDTLEASDVVASMDKWLKTSTQGKANLKDAEFVEVDPLTVELHITQPSLIVPYVLADQAPFPAIVPEESVTSSDETGLTDYIGTGPFQLAEWAPDQRIVLNRFDDYASREEETTGLGGKKEALVKEVVFHIVTDVSTRVSGITTGEYDIAFDIPLDNAEQIEYMEGVTASFNPAGTAAYVFNKAEGPFSDIKLREAFNTALNVEEALLTAYSNPEYYTLDSALALPDQTDWYSQAGSEQYNLADVELAKQLVEESDYNGEEVVILTTRDYPDHYNLAIVAQQTLESIGVNVRLDIFDWPTTQEVRKDPANFDIFPMTFAIRPTIHQNPFLDSTAAYAGWTNSPEIDQLLVDITQESDFDSAKPIIDELQQAVWDYLPIVKLGNYTDLSAIGENVQGYSELIGPVLWNVSKSE